MKQGVEATLEQDFVDPRLEIDKLSLLILTRFEVFVPFSPDFVPGSTKARI